MPSTSSPVVTRNSSIDTRPPTPATITPTGMPATTRTRSPSMTRVTVGRVGASPSVPGPRSRVSDLSFRVSDRGAAGRATGEVDEAEHQAGTDQQQPGEAGG